MSTFRYVLAWFYLILGVFDASVTIFIMPRIVTDSRPDFRHSLDLFLIYVAMHIFLFAAGIVFLLAWWILRADSVSGKRWVISASLTNLFVALGVPLLFLRFWGTAGLWSGVKLFTIPVAFGVAGLFRSPTHLNTESLRHPQLAQFGTLDSRSVSRPVVASDLGFRASYRHPEGAAKLAVDPAGEEPASRTCPVATEVIPDGGEGDLSCRGSGVNVPAAKARAASGSVRGTSKSAGCSERSEPLAAKRGSHR